MSNTKHTPAPWGVQRDAVPDWHAQYTIYSEEGGERVATVFQSESNATLIARAPAMAEVLRELVDLHEIANAVEPSEMLEALPLENIRAAWARAQAVLREVEDNSK